MVSRRDSNEDLKGLAVTEEGGVMVFSSGVVILLVRNGKVCYAWDYVRGFQEIVRGEVADRISACLKTLLGGTQLIPGRVFLVVNERLTRTLVSLGVVITCEITVNNGNVKSKEMFREKKQILFQLEN